MIRIIRLLPVLLVAPFFANAQMPAPVMPPPAPVIQVPQSIWLDAANKPNAKANEALALIAHAGSDGLNPEAYNFLGALSNPQSPDEAKKYDTALSDGFLAFLHDEAVGRIPVGPERDKTFAASFDKAAALQIVAGLSADDLDKYVDDLKPQEPDYAMLRQTLADLRDQLRKGQTWAAIPLKGPSLKPGMKNPVVPQVRARLGLAPVDDNAADVYDDALSGAVQAFQQTHALTDDGHLGPDTRKALSMPLESRIAEVIAAMERLRWLPHDLGQRYVFDNVGGYWSRYVDGGKVQFQLPIIVGRPERETPLLISTINEAVLNPSWTVPPTIIKKDVIPGLRKNSDYLTKKHIIVYRHGDNGLEEVSAADYASDGGGSEYILRQPPGEENPLGAYKLNFPNVYSIYMHDTDEKRKFTAAVRNFSSGCIRVQNVRQLISAVLAGQLTDDQIDKFLAKGDTKIIKLNNPLPVYITYLSVWSDINGHTIFGPDQYGKDVALAAKIGAP